MANVTTTISEVRERVWTHAIITASLGLAMMAAAGIGRFFVKYMNLGTNLPTSMNLLAVVWFAGLGIVGLSCYKFYQAFKAKGVSTPCPFCEYSNFFVEMPTGDYDCEKCDRTVHYIAGKPIPVRKLVCQYCKTEHIIPINVEHFVCDSCNRTIEVVGGKAKRQSGNVEGDALLQNFDVVLIAVDRRKETDVALKLQNLLVVNLPEARRLMLSASAGTPLIIGHDLPQRKAETIRRQLQDLGATASLRATATKTR